MCETFCESPPTRSYHFWLASCFPLVAFGDNAGVRVCSARRLAADPEYCRPSASAQSQSQELSSKSATADAGRIGRLLATTSETIPETQVFPQTRERLLLRDAAKAPPTDDSTPTGDDEEADDERGPTNGFERTR